MAVMSSISGKIAKPVSRRRPLFVALVAAAFGLAPLAAQAVEPNGIAGAWQISRDDGRLSCRVGLNPERSDLGEFFAAIPFACKHAMPLLGKVGRWSMTDDSHLALTSPEGEAVLDLTRSGGVFLGKGADGGDYKLTPLHALKSARTNIDLGAEPAGGKASAIALGAQPSEAAPAPKRPMPVLRPSDLAGRYAILREGARDTGCMLTLDGETRVRGGERAALAPACRDQGLVVFDPVAWQIVNGRLVLTAKAGHVTHLDRQDDGTWLKDPKEGKSLTLKKL